MHAFIRFNQSISKVLRYHEEKVRLGKASTIAAENFLKDWSTLTVPEARYHFERLTSRNEAVAKNVLHVFLTFDQYEKIDNAKMAYVAGDYIEGMRFGDQPWLAYRHSDSLIPHAHLVSTNVREDGTKIKIEKRDLYHSLELARSLEESYGLNRSNRESLLLADTDGQWEKVRYGEKPVYSSMKQVLDDVVPNYAYTTLDELNALLSLHNMRADIPAQRRELGSNAGLYYRPLADDGSPMHIAVNASAFPSKPGLHNLEERFVTNQALREPAGSHLATAIDWCLAGTPLSLGAFKENMSYEGISVVFRHTRDGALQNCWFLDHDSRTVFEGAALGEKYSAQGLAARCIPEEQWLHQQRLEQQETQRYSLHL